MKADVEFATNPAQVNHKRKRRKKKSDSVATDHDNNDTRILKQIDVISTNNDTQETEEEGLELKNSLFSGKLFTIIDEFRLKSSELFCNLFPCFGVSGLLKTQGKDLTKKRSGIKSIVKLERGKGLFQRVRETIRPLLNVSIFDDITSSDDEPKKKRRKKKKKKSLEANSEKGVQTENQTVKEKEVHDKLEPEKPGLVVNDESEQPKKNKKRKRKTEDKNLEANSETGVHNEDQTVDNLSVASNLSVEKSLNLFSKRKLLVLDINGLLADVVYPAPKNCTPDKRTAGRAIFMRPFYIDFLNFCFERFDVGIWSSRTKRIIDLVVECLLGKLKQKLIFCWDQTHCTPTTYRTLENKHKPLLFKELGKIWENKDPNLPWEKGFYNKSNTLLIDDSPYKALLNPKNTAIFPPSFTYMDKQDSSLAPGGDIRVYLEKVAEAENIQKYVEQNPFGQVGIDEKHESWSYYSKFEELRSLD